LVVSAELQSIAGPDPEGEPVFDNEYVAEKLTAAEHAQLVRDMQRRRIIAARGRHSAKHQQELPLSGRTLTELIPRFANPRLRTL
jgi:hypothetical protein